MSFLHLLLYSRSRASRLIMLGLALLAILLAGVGVFIVRAADRDFGAIGVQAAMASGLICFLGTGLALCLSRPTGDPQRDTKNLLLSIVARTGIPLAAALLLSRIFELPLQSVFSMVLSYYLVALTIEAWFAVRLVRRTPA